MGEYHGQAQLPPRADRKQKRSGHRMRVNGRTATDRTASGGGRSPNGLRGIALGLWIALGLIVVALVATLEFTWWLANGPFQWWGLAGTGALLLVVLARVLMLRRRAHRSCHPDRAEAVAGQQREREQTGFVSPPPRQVEASRQPAVRAVQPPPSSLPPGGAEPEDGIDQAASTTPADTAEREIPLLADRGKLEELRAAIIAAFPELADECAPEQRNTQGNSGG